MTKNNQDNVVLAQLFKVLGDPTRLAILRLLMDGEENVSTVCMTLKMPQPSVSHHLGILRMGGLVQTRRDGKQVYYSICKIRRERSSRLLKSLLNGSRSVRLGPIVLGLAGR